MRVHNGTQDEAAKALRQAASKLSQDLSRTAQDAQAAAAEFAAALQQSTTQFGDGAMRQAVGAKHAVEERVRRHPITWVAIAAGVGGLAALMMARRR